MSAPDLFTLRTDRVARPVTTSTKRGRRIAFNVAEGEDVRIITPAGRDAWALGELLLAGETGCTPITMPGPRWSHYVFKLKRIYRLNVETVTEMHGGEYAGHHARYVLRSLVAFADPADEARARCTP